MLQLPFSPKSEACTVKLGHSQVLDISRHSGSDPKFCDGSMLLNRTTELGEVYGGATSCAVIAYIVVIV